MNRYANDPMGQAIQDFASGLPTPDIIVESELCEDDVMPVPLLFRSFDQMPEIEQLALSQCTGKILDIGSGSGCHALYLKEKGFDVHSIDLSPGAIDYQLAKGLNSRLVDFFELQHETYDTLLFLMNGLGIGGTLSRLEATLLKAKELLNPGGQLIGDSSDLKYLYEDDEGGYWIDLSAEYYGNFRYKMRYKNTEGDWFDWLYVDFDTLKNCAEKIGFSVELLFEKDNHYLVKLIKR
jgi:SAM-dependent methyltransferase